MVFVAIFNMCACIRPKHYAYFHFCVLTQQNLEHFASIYLYAEMDCGEPPQLANGDFSIASTSVNSSAVYFCVEGYKETGADNTIQCLPNGMWSELNLECVPGEQLQFYFAYALRFKGYH